MECRTCGQAFDPANLAAVFLHEHWGLSDLPGLDDVPLGESVE